MSGGPPLARASRDIRGVAVQLRGLLALGRLTLPVVIVSLALPLSVVFLQRANKIESWTLALHCIINMIILFVMATAYSVLLTRGHRHAAANVLCAGVLAHVAESALLHAFLPISELRVKAGGAGLNPIFFQAHGFFFTLHLAAGLMVGAQPLTARRRLAVAIVVLAMRSAGCYALWVRAQEPRALTFMLPSFSLSFLTGLLLGSQCVHHLQRVAVDLEDISGGLLLQEESGKLLQEEEETTPPGAAQPASWEETNPTDARVLNGLIAETVWSHRLVEAEADGHTAPAPFQEAASPQRPKKRPVALKLGTEELRPGPMRPGAFDDAALTPLLRSARIAAGGMRLGNVVGRGSFGEVCTMSWSAGDAAGRLADVGAPPVLAVKKIYRQHLQSDMQLGGVKRALETELKLQPHAHVCRCFGWACCEENGLLIVIEYCGGGTLMGALQAGRTTAWPMRRKLLVAAQLAEGLASLHGHVPPVIHRDLKPDNVLFDSSGAVKICDLGLSRTVDMACTMTGAIGTPVFLAPEQLSYQRYDQASDVWSAGCVLACLANDSPLPYPEQLKEGLLARIARGEVRPYVPEDCAVHGVVNDCCQVVSTERLTAAHLAAELLGALLVAKES